MAVLYFEELQVRPQDPHWEERDRFVLSKGHVCPVLYSCLALRGYFPMDVVKTLRKEGSMLQGHPDMKRCPGVDISTGSLGQGLSTAVGMALAGKRDERKYRVFCLVGDGESQEGQIWEASMFARQMKLGNLIAFLDKNGLQIDGALAQINELESAADKWRAFGWHVQEIDGHDMRAIYDAIENAKARTDLPSMIVMNTVKGKGWKKIEGTVKSHSMPISQEDVADALRDLA